MVDTSEIETALRNGADAWRNLSEPETNREYARVAGKLSTLLREVSDLDEDTDDFALAEALYAFTTHYHGGQWCPLYAAFSQLSRSPIGFRPAMSGDGLDDLPGARRVYSFLVRSHARNRSRAVAFAERATVILWIRCNRGRA